MRFLARLVACMLCGVSTGSASPRTGISPTTGIRDTNPRLHAIVGARVV
ncbi:MAG: hypothetical protein VYD18_06060 [Candidatus Latescibacterota bacterium]|nr:hypothetical protein [Candidatus Latescibacterota bacterium]